MKICFVGPANSAHLIKWCNWFTNQGHEIHVISFTPGKIDGANVHSLNIRVNTDGKDLGKIKYLFTGRRIRKIIREIQPDIINAHYATSYGVAMALSGVKGYVLSVWGSDVYDFPRKSIFHKILLQYSFIKASHLFSTSQAMANEARKYTKKEFIITPFGVDMELFNPNKRTRKGDRPFTIGTVKTLSRLYGIDYILKAAAILKSKKPDLDIILRIAGDGPQAGEYKELAEELSLDAITTFLGKISQEEAATEWANMDVAVIPSILYESFGVAAIEAQASGTPVIVSDAGGLLETTEPDKSSIVVNRGDEYAIAEAIMELYKDPLRRKSMGKEGRKNVVEKYELNHCFRYIEKELIKCIAVDG